MNNCDDYSWKTLKKLDNPPTARAALEIIREDKSISTDLREVLDKWYQDISGLFAGLHEDPELAFNEEFYEEILKKKAEFEEMPFEEQRAEGAFNTDEMNSEISYDEVSDAINSSKFKKAYLNIPNEALKNKMQSYCFTNFSTSAFCQVSIPQTGIIVILCLCQKKTKIHVIPYRTGVSQ